MDNEKFEIFYLREVKMMWTNEKKDPELRNNVISLAHRFDKSNMAKVITDSPRQIETALEMPLPEIPRGNFDRVIIAGMGGSALPAEVVMDAFAEHIIIPISVVRHYYLPKSIKGNCLIIVSSFSGETEETLSILEKLPNNSTNVVVISAGGRLKTKALQRGYPYIEIPTNNEPSGFQPRSAVGYFVTFFARILVLAGVMDDFHSEFSSVPQFLRDLDIRGDAEDVALWMKDQIPVVYTDELHQMSIARITKIKLNENSKRPAFFNCFPEGNHNEMIGLSKKGLGNFCVLYLHDPSSHPRIYERFDVMRKVFEENRMNHISFRKWEIPGTTMIEKIFAALMFADWCSYTLAILDQIDPTPVVLVESFKKALSPI